MLFLIIILKMNKMLLDVNFNAGMELKIIGLKLLGELEKSNLINKYF